MLDLILSVAKNDERIRAVILNGSRVNDKIPKDDLQDFDVVFLVKELDSFCLLYTSPSPRDQRGSRMPSSA